MTTAEASAVRRWGRQLAMLDIKYALADERMWGGYRDLCWTFAATAAVLGSIHRLVFVASALLMVGSFICDHARRKRERRTRAVISHMSRLA